VTTSRGVWVAPEEIELASRRVSGLPVVNAVLARLGFDELLPSYLPEPDSRCRIPPARAIGVLVRNLALGRQPLYGLGEWAAGFEPQLLGLDAAAPETLSDDCVGRALDELFSADRASLLTSLSLSAITARIASHSTSCTTTRPRSASTAPIATRMASPEAGSQHLGRRGASRRITARTCCNSCGRSPSRPMARSRSPTACSMGTRRIRPRTSSPGSAAGPGSPQSRRDRLLTSTETRYWRGLQLFC